VPRELGKPTKKTDEPRERGLKIDLPFDDALRAALEKSPPAAPGKKRGAGRRKH